VGESTKAASHGYIGAKGIGFKSVFIAAWKVEIQSGDYTFYFKHDRGDLGLGMVLPVWLDVGDELPESFTRITLHLHQKGDPEEIDYLHQTIFKQLNDLEQTCLLFLRNIKEIRLSFYDEEDELQGSKRFYLEGNASRKVSLKTESADEDGGETIRISDYYVTRYMGSGLPKSDNRELPATPEGQQDSAQAETVLAFPVERNNQPLLEPQSVFAFLPVRKTSFKVSYGQNLRAKQLFTCHSSSSNPTSTRVQVDRTYLRHPDETFNSWIMLPRRFARLSWISRLTRTFHTCGQCIFLPQKMPPEHSGASCT
jgi:hypothetical protein